MASALELLLERGSQSKAELPNGHRHAQGYQWRRPRHSGGQHDQATGGERH